jgi:hypothetical protein
MQAAAFCERGVSNNLFLFILYQNKCDAARQPESLLARNKFVASALPRFLWASVAHFSMFFFASSRAAFGEACPFVAT